MLGAAACEPVSAALQSHLQSLPAGSKPRSAPSIGLVPTPRTAAQHQEVEAAETAVREHGTAVMVS